MRRRFVWIQGAVPVEPALFSLWQGPNGYYVVNSAGVPTLAAPYFDDFSPGGIFRAGFTVTGTNDWRYGAVGADSSFATRNGLFYGPSGLVASFTTAALGIGATGTFGSGVLLGALDQRDLIRQRYWYTETASGNGPNTWPIADPTFALPGQKFATSTGSVYQNSDLTWAVQSGQLLKADGTFVTITSGEPVPWPNIILNSQSACFVGLTLFVFSWPPVAPSVTFTPYHYKPDTGTVVKGADIVMPYSPLGSGYILRYVGFWSPEIPLVFYRFTLIVGPDGTNSFDTSGQVKGLVSITSAPFDYADTSEYLVSFRGTEGLASPPSSTTAVIVQNVPGTIEFIAAARQRMTQQFVIPASLLSGTDVSFSIQVTQQGSANGNRHWARIGCDKETVLNGNTTSELLFVDSVSVGTNEIGVVRSDSGTFTLT